MWLYFLIAAVAIVLAYLFLFSGAVLFARDKHKFGVRVMSRLLARERIQLQASTIDELLKMCEWSLKLPTGNKMNNYVDEIRTTVFQVKSVIGGTVNKEDEAIFRVLCNDLNNLARR